MRFHELNYLTSPFKIGMRCTLENTIDIWKIKYFDYRWIDLINLTNKQPKHRYMSILTKNYKYLKIIKGEE